ncbi:hypothetical protein [Spelaeicoccus albus]|uniref:Uncharacterized protein n=1 Tax=Spelaeicoccus albus TaxID=1280376 RepID=A0A7Z0AC05_9MICO|nr:hypothetical protein [Spelaeicoccus albus]NYI67085.1 hypothetical protein [Spelaeicoccus albus]
MSTLREYLLAYRGIDVSSTDADALDAFWASLRSRRSTADNGGVAADDIPVVFDPTVVMPTERGADG